MKKHFNAIAIGLLLIVMIFSITMLLSYNSKNKALQSASVTMEDLRWENSILTKDIYDLKLKLQRLEGKNETYNYEGFSYQYIWHVQELFKILEPVLPIMYYDNQFEKQYLDFCLEWVLSNGDLGENQVILMFDKPEISTINPNHYSVIFTMNNILSEPTKAEHLPAAIYTDGRIIIVEYKDNNFEVVEYRRVF